MRQEAPGILNRLVAGCLEWQKHGLRPPEKVTLATDEYREEMDVLAEFMDEHCILGERHQITQKELYICYADWCEALRQRPQNYRLFNRQLKERNFRTKVARIDGKSIRVWFGISLRGGGLAPRAPFAGMRVADA